MSEAFRPYFSDLRKFLPIERITIRTNNCLRGRRFCYSFDKGKQREIATHNLAEAEALADQIAIIYRGKILLNGTLEELKRVVLGPVEYEAKFAHEFDAGEFELPAGAVLASRSATSLRFRVEAPQDVNPKLVNALTSRNAPLVSFQEVPKKLEHVYLKTMADAQGVVYAA